MTPDRVCKNQYSHPKLVQAILVDTVALLNLICSHQRQSNGRGTFIHVFTQFKDQRLKWKHSSPQFNTCYVYDVIYVYISTFIAQTRCCLFWRVLICSNVTTSTSPVCLVWLSPMKLVGNLPNQWPHWGAEMSRLLPKDQINFQEVSNEDLWEFQTSDYYTLAYMIAILIIYIYIHIN